MISLQAKEVKDLLQNLIAKLTKPLWAKPVTSSIVSYAKSRIDGQIDTDNKPFTKLAKSTIERKALFASGKMYGSFVLSISGNKLTFTNTAEYSSIHQEGLNGIPKRQFMGAPPDLANTILQFVIGSK